MGKMFLLRLLLLIAALDPRAEVHAYDFKGTGDLAPLEAVAHRCRAGDDDEDMAYALADFRALREELRRRTKVIRGLPRDVCPENKVTPELASNKSLRLNPVVIDAHVDDEHRQDDDGDDGIPCYYRHVAMIAPDAEIERVELAPAAALFRSLGEPARLMIVRLLATGPARVTDLTAGLGLAQSTVSKHLACLRDCGLVTSEPAGRSSVFRLAQPALGDVLAAAEAVLAATGNAVALCPVWGGDCCDGEE